MSTTAKEKAPSTALSTLEQSKYLAIRPNSDIAEALQANLVNGETIGESDLLRVPTPAGGLTKWTIDDLDGEKTVEEIVGVLVYYGLGGVLWPSQEPSNGSLPLLRTDDLITAYKVGEDLGDIKPEELAKYENADGTYNWQQLPWNQFGSGKNGAGKRCQEYRILCILREQDSFPLLVRAKPGSLKTVAPFIKRLPVPHFRAVIGLKLEKAENKGGQKYSRIIPRLVDKLSSEEGARIREIYTEAIGQAAHDIAAEPDGDPR